MSKPKVLISDKLDPLAVKIFEDNGVTPDFKPGLSADELLDIIGDYDGLAIRSATKVTQEVLEKAKNLKVVGRAGIGVDNVDVEAATNQGVVVMNTPFGNAITTAEHAIAMMFSLAREIPTANASTHEGKWEKKKFMGTELTSKTLGVIGCGNIGSIAASRGIGLKMRVIAYDPYLSDEKAIELGVEKVEIDDLFGRSDFITIHVPKNQHTANLINKDSIAKMKDGVRIINCARGGIVNEQDLKEALESGKIAGAALDVFEEEPAKDNILFGLENVVCTPHLGASTTEAQVNVALQVAEQMSDYLVNGAVTNALNMPSISSEDAPKLKPYMKLAEQLGSFAGQITNHAIEEVCIEYHGSVAELNIKPLTAILIASLLKPQLESVNMVNAPAIAQSRGIEIKESQTGSSKDWRSLISVGVKTSQRQRTIAGTLFTGKEPRIVDIEGVQIEAALSEHMLFLRNEDKPGLVGAVGSLLGDANQNIADFRLGRQPEGQTAVCLVSLDSEIPDDLFEKVANLPQIESLKKLSFS